MTNKKKRFFSMFFYTILLIFLYTLGEQYLRYLVSVTGTISADSMNVYWVGLSTLLGFGIALPGFVSEVRKKGKWRVDWVKLAAVGLPLLLIIIVNISPTLKWWIHGIPYWLSTWVFGDDVGFAVLNHISISTSANPIIGVVFGYLFLTSVFRMDINNAISEQ